MEPMSLKNECIETESNVKCAYCGKSYTHSKRTFTVCGTTKIFEFDNPNCDCAERIKKQKEEQAIKEAEIERKRIQTAKLFENSMITPFFKEKTFDNLRQTEEIIRCKRYVEEFIPTVSKGIQMFGSPGTGKTTALAAVCNELISRGYNCLFTPLSTLLDKFSRHSYSNSGDVTDLLKWLTAFDFVVLDDIGRESYTDKRKENVFRIIDSLMNYKTVTAFTANPDMIMKLKTIPELDAALDRLKDMCPIKFEFRGESYRGKQ